MERKGVGCFLMDMNRMIALFMDFCQSKALRPKTMGSYEQALKLFARWMEDVKHIRTVDKVAEEHIRDYILDLQKRGKYTFCVHEHSKALNHPSHRRDYRQKISNITINNYLRNMKVFFTWLVESDCIPKSPMEKIHPLPQERPPKEYLEDDEVKLLMKSMDRSYFSEYRDMMVMLLMLDSGMRLGETLTIENGQLDIMGQCVSLPADKTKGRKERTVFFSRKTAKELRRWLQYKDRYCESAFVFPVKHNGRMLAVSNYETNFAHYIERAGIKKHISPHTLRNNFARRCLMSGMDIYTLSRIMGHSSVTVTEEAYLDIQDRDLKKRYSRFSPIENIYYGGK